MPLASPSMPPATLSAHEMSANWRMRCRILAMMATAMMTAMKMMTYEAMLRQRGSPMNWRCWASSGWNVCAAQKPPMRETMAATSPTKPLR